MTKTILVLLFAVTFRTGISAQTFIQNIDIQCGDTAYVGGLGYPTWNIPEITDYPKYGHALLLGDFIPANLLQYQAPFYYSGVDTVVIKCAKATQITCDTGIYVFHVGCSTVYEPVYTFQVACKDTFVYKGLSGFSVPMIVQEAQHGQSVIIPGATDGTTFTYIPDPDFEGLDNVLVSLYLGQDTVNFLFQVYCNGVVGSSNGPQIQPAIFYPQPGSSLVFAEGIKGDVHSVKVMDVSGRTTSVRYETDQEKVSMDISSLPPGIYVVEIRTGPGQVWVGKMVKQE